MASVNEVRQKGLTWRVMLALLFSIFIVQPAIIYFYLISNTYLPVQAWITILLWAELTRYLVGIRGLSKQELFILLTFQPMTYMYALFFVLPIKNMYYAISEPVRVLGIAQYIPDWWVPKGGALKEVIASQWVYFHSAWVKPILITLAIAMLGLVSDIILGYFNYQVFVVTEKLEFPAALAAVNTVVTLAERPTDKIRVLYLSALAGIIVHLVSKFIPFIIGPFMYGGMVAYTYYMPMIDFTDYLDYILPGASFLLPLDPLLYVPGMMLPPAIALAQFIGAFALYFFGTYFITKYQLWPMESKWATGWGYWTLQYRALLYFYVSLLIGLCIAGLVVPIAVNPRPIISGFRAMRRAAARVGGLLSPKILLSLYILSSVGIVLITWGLTGYRFPLWILLGFILGGSFFITYLSTASVGVTFYGFSIPFFRELMIYYSGYKGRDIWFVPLPVSFSGTITAVTGAAYAPPSLSVGGSAVTQALMQADVCGVSHGEFLKAYLLIIALGLFSSFLYTSIFWYVAPMPSSAYPATIINWPVDALTWARTQVWVWSGYLFRSNWILSGFLIGAASYVLTHFALHAPYLLVSAITGAFMGIPFAFAQLIGSILGEKIFAPRVGKRSWYEYRGLVVMGYTLGDGFMELLRAVIILMRRSLWLLPY